MDDIEHPMLNPDGRPNGNDDDETDEGISNPFQNNDDDTTAGTIR